MSAFACPTKIGLGRLPQVTLLVETPSAHAMVALRWVALPGLGASTTHGTQIFGVSIPSNVTTIDQIAHCPDIDSRRVKHTINKHFRGVFFYA